MFGFYGQAVEFTAEHEQLLKQTTVDRDGPGTILHDFAGMVDYVHERDMRVTGMHQLPLRALSELNARLARPVEHGLQRPVPKSLPPILGLYLLLRASGLTYVDETGSKPILRLDDEVYGAWQDLNPTEQYFTLLEVWLLRGFPEIVGERDWGMGPVPRNFGSVMSLMARMTDGALQVAGDSDAEDYIRYILEWHNLGLVGLFGLVDVRTLPPEPGEGWRIDTITATPFGNALLALLYNAFFGDWDNIRALGDEDVVPFGVLQPYFPEWQRNLPVPALAFRHGAHVFKVSMGRIWRRMAISAEASLDILARGIVDAFDFWDHSHLYEFKYRNRFGAMQGVHHPYMDEGPWTSQVRVGDVPLGLGQTMTYVFDFGDWWEFDVTLEAIDTDMEIDGPKVLESQGEPPEQYPSWDDWEDEE